MPQSTDVQIETNFCANKAVFVLFSPWAGALYLKVGAQIQSAGGDQKTPMQSMSMNLVFLPQMSSGFWCRAACCKTQHFKKKHKCIIDYVWSWSKEVDKWAVNSIPDCAPWLILAPRSLLLSKGLSLNPRDTTLSISTDSFPIANTDFFPHRPLRWQGSLKVKETVHKLDLSLLLIFYLF